MKILKIDFQNFFISWNVSKIISWTFLGSLNNETIVKYAFHEIVWKKYFTVYPRLKKVFLEHVYMRPEVNSTGLRYTSGRNFTSVNNSSQVLFEEITSSYTVKLKRKKMAADLELGNYPYKNLEQDSYDSGITVAQSSLQIRLGKSFFICTFFKF